MKKPTILKFGLLSLIFLQSIISYSQNLVSYVEKTNQAIKTEKFLVGSFPLNEQFGGSTNDGTNKASSTVAALENPVIPYAQLPYAGQVAECPNDGKLLPKLFLCGGNDSRPIDIKITDARSIIWERFISGGSCVTVSNSDCANDNASDACWVKVGDERVYIANTAGQFRIKIIDNAGNPYTFYFNVYQNTLIPTAITKSDIIKNSTGTCKVDGKIKVGGFGDGYEYSFTTTGSPGTWDVNNTFTTSTPGNYTAFIRIKGVVGSCEFKVLNQDIKSVTLAVSTEVVAPRCFNGKGSIKVIKNDNSKAYTFNIYKPANSTTRLAFYDVEADKELEYTFKDLDPGTYRVETVLQETKCVIDNKTSVVIPNAPAELTSNPVITKTLTPCRPGTITVGTGGGTYPFRYLVSINGAPFFQNANNVITTVLSGSYLIRIEDANGCSVEKTIPVKDIDKPTYTVTKTDGDCTNPNGKITINVTDSKGYTIETRIRGENSFTTTSYITMSLTGTIGNTVYNNVSPENYIISVKYTKSGNTCTDPDFPIAIGLTTALTASVGVAELSGCGPVGNVKQGKVRITNAEGGVPLTGPDGPYLYSYDDRKTWVTDKEMYVDPGTHIFYIKDQKCEIPLKAITLLDQPKPPTISVDDPVFNCDGSATTTVTVTNSGSPTTQFTYDYFIDGVLNTNTPTNIFKNVTQGDHTISVSYNVLNVPTESVLLNESFGSGPDVSSPGMNPNFCWERQVEATKCNNDKMFGNGEYTVTSSLKNSPYPQGWRYPVDHTSGSSSGRFLAVDAGNAIPNNAVLYRKTINDIIPNVPIKVTFVATNLLKKGNTQPDASLTVELQNGSGVALSSQSTGKIPKTNDWVDYTRIIDPGNNTTLDFVLRLELSQVDGIDFAVDDLVVTQMPKACNTVANFPIFVDGSKAFSAGITGYKDVRCSGDQNGEITLSAKNFDAGKGFQYLVTGDPAGWQTVKPVPAASSGSITLTNLASKIYNISIRYDDTAGSCTFPLAQEIKSPAVLDVKASIVLAATCTEGATIRASATGGTPAYEFELLDATGKIVIKQRQPVSDPVAMTSDFTDIDEGTYIVKGYDQNECTDNINATIEVKKPGPIEAVLANSSNLCYTAANKASITVTVNGGIAPYTYSLNGAAAQDSNVFKDLVPGSYIVTVIDGNKCTDDTDSIVINEELIVKSSITQTLKCVVAPATSSAVITGKIEGGTAGYTVVRTSGPGTGVIAYPTTDTFTFTGSVPGLYKFEITDSKGCKTTTEATIQSLTNPVANAAPENPKCFGAATGSVILSGSGGSGSGYEYNFNGGGFKADATYSGLSANIKYTYQVKDGNGCLSTIKDFTLTQPLELKGDIKATEIGCDGNDTKPATVTVTGIGGSGGYKYRFNNETTFVSAPGNTFSTSTAGEVSAYIQDSNGCIIGPLKITIDPLYSITGITLTDNGYDCSTTPPGGHVNIAAIKAGVSAPVRYQIISGPAGYNAAQNSDGEFKSLTPGLYMFRAIDIKTGCYFDKPYTVKGAPDIVAGGSVVTPIKCFGGTGKIRFTVNGVKDQGYSYEIVNVATPNVVIQDGKNVPETTTTIDVVAALPKGSYTITAIDKKTSCEATYTVILTEPTAAVAVTATASKINCKNGKSDITVTVLGGTPNYSYAVAKATVPVGPKPTTFGPDAVLTVDTNAGADLKWIVYVKDANGCEGQFTVDIEKEDMPTVTAVLENQCTATGTGNIFTIKVTGSSGLAPLKYSIDGTNFQSGQTFNVTDGTYTVTVQDKYGCTATAPAAIVVDKKLTAGASVTKGLDCSTTPNAVITVNINGGKAPYKYTIQKGTGTPGGQITATTLPILFPVTAADADKYTFAIVDGNNCPISVDATVLTISNPAVAVKSFVHPSCDGGANGSITLEATGGSGGGYQYSMDGGPFTTDTYYPNLAAGLHNYKITDGKSCPASGSFTLAAPALLEVVVVEQKFTCDTSNGKVAGTVTLNASGGTGVGTYQYSFNGGGAGPNNVLTITDTTRDHAYTYIVTDANGCPVSGSGTLLKLNPPKILEIKGTTIYCKPAANTESTVTVTMTPSTGVQPLKYEITAPITQAGTVTGPSTGEFNNLPAGPTGTLYSFRVTDNNGCYAEGTYRVEPAVNIALTATIANNVYCKGGSTGTIKMDVTGFTGTYKYSVNGTEIATGQTATTINHSGLSEGNYIILVTDEVTGCEATKTLNISEPAKILTAIVDQKNANCTVTTTKVTVTPDGGSGTYKYAFVPKDADPTTSYGLSNSADLSATPTAEWDVWVKDSNNCTFLKQITLATDARPTVTADAVGECLGDGTAYTITAYGSGVAPLKYNINGGSYQTGTTFTVTTDGTYHIGVIDANGCTSVAKADVEVAQKLTLSPFFDKNINCEAGAAAAAKVTLTAGGGTPGYTYTSSPTTGFFEGALNNIFRTTTPDTYTFTVTDSKGCTVTSSVKVTVTEKVDPVILAVNNVLPVKCFGSATASISISIDDTKGVKPFLINVKNTTTGEDFKTQTTGLTAGVYKITLTDANGCTAEAPVTIDDKEAIGFKLESESIRCNTSGSGNTLGSITIKDPKGGTLPYKYSISNNFGSVITPNTYTDTTGDGYTFLNIIDYGIYTVNLVDANNCSLSQQIVMASPPSDLEIDVTTTPATCTTGGSAIVKAVTVIAGNDYEIGILTSNVAPYSNNYHDVASPDYTYTFDNLVPGVTYTFVVHDKNSGCYILKVADPIPAVVGSMTTVVKEKNVTCLNSGNGSVVFSASNVDGSVTTVDYQIFAAQSNAIISPVLTHTVSPLGANFTSASYPELLPDNSGPIPGHAYLPPGEYYIVFIEKVGAVTKCKSSSLPFSIKETPVEFKLSVSPPNNANCKPDSGIITAIVDGGSAPYKYQFLPAGDPAPTESSTAWSDENNYKTNIAGNYTVYAMDGFGCIKNVDVELKKDAPPVMGTLDPICFDGSEFTITVPGTVTVGTAMYSINGSNFQADPKFNFSAAGTYNLVVRDDNYCDATLVYDVYPELKLKVNKTKDLDCSTTKPNATIELTASGGTLPTPTYTYEYSTNGGGLYTPIAALLPGNIFEATIAGDYIFRLTDTANPELCQVTESIKIDPIPAIVFDTVETNVTCFDADNGTIKVTVTSGVGPFKYTLTDGTTTWGPQDSFEFKNLPANVPAAPFYTVTVRDGTLCTKQKTNIIITQPLELIAAAPSVSDYNCDLPVNGKKSVVVTVTADPTTGTAPYRYKLGSATVYSDANTLTVENGDSAILNVPYSIIDANDCTVNGTVPVDPYKVLTDLKIVSATPITCDPLQYESTVTIEAEGGYPGSSPAPAYTYAIVAPASETGNISGQTSGVFTDLKSGLTYTFKATDSHGCSIENTHKVDPVVEITASGANVNNVSCKTTTPAGSDGTVAFTIANFTGAYTYTLSTALGIVTKSSFTGYDVITVKDLPVGTYQIDIEDSVTHCKTSATAAVTEPTDPLSIAIVSNKNANCDFGAKVVVQAAGGTLDYKYAFAEVGNAPDYTTKPTSNFATLDPTKSWIAWVQDKNNCEAQIAIPIAVDPNPTIDNVSMACYKDGEGPVKITLNGTYAVGPPKYNIGNGWKDYNTFELNAPGPYVFSIMDGNGCVSTTPFKYTLNQELLLTADKTSDITCKASPGDLAVINLTVTQGAATLPYGTIEYSTDGVNFNPITVNPFTTSTAGTYTFRVKDAAGCEAVSKEVIVGDKTTPDFTYVKKDITCFGANNGSFKITPADGLAPYKYSIDGGVNYPKTGTDNEFIGLTPQTYHVYVMDAKECVTTHDITIDEPGELDVKAVVTPFGCSPTNAPLEAIVTLNATFGTTPYSYSFDNGDTFSDLVNTLSVGTAQTIKYVVVDKNGCRVSGDAIVDVYNAPKDMVLEATPIYCSNLAGTATVTVTSVAGPPVGTAYTYEIISPVAAAVSNTDGIFAGLVPDTYTIKATDDASKCYTISSIVVKKAAEISVDKQSYSDVQCNGTTTGSVTFTVSNYITAGNYAYNLTPNPLGIVPVQVGDAITYSGLGTGTYTFNVSDGVSGCTDSVVNLLIDQPAKPLDFTTVATDINCIGKNAIITVTVDPTTGTGPSYQYAVLETGSTATPVYGDSNKLEVNTNNGTKLSWDVYVKDANNCSLTKIQTIATAALPTGISVAPYSQCPDPVTKKYTFTVNVTAGVTPFTYSINGVDFQTDNAFIVDNAGTYNVTVKDGNGCPATTTIPVVIAPKLTLAYKIDILPSCDERDGEITVSATGGSSSANYVYNLDDNGFPQTAPGYTFKNISSGAHFIEVTDTATGCKDRVDFTIKAATPVVGLTVVGTPVTCFGSTNGTITASITTGTANDNPVYRYELFGTSKGSPVQDVNIPLQTSGSFTNLKPGDYTVRVVSGRGCKDTKFFRVLEPAIITLDAPLVSPYGCTTLNKSNYATVTIDKTKILGGSGNYIRFQFIKTSNANEIVYDGTSNVYTETDFLGGKYIVNVYDDKGCMATSTEVEIFPFIDMDKIDVAITPITCIKNEDIAVTVKDSKGVTFTVPLEYKLDGINGTIFTETNTDGLFSDLPIGQYLISVRNPATGCVVSKIHYVNDPNTFELVASNVNNVVCFGSATGSVDLTIVDKETTPSDDAGAFDYTITGPVNITGNSGGATINIPNLLAGTYTVKAKLTGKPTCDVETTFLIEQPATALTLKENHTPISCDPGNDGTILAIAEGGWPGDLQYELVGPVNVAYSSQFFFEGLTPGFYTLNVKDVNGCIQTATVTLKNPDPILVTATATVSALICNGDNSGEITVDLPTGGQGSNYSYILNYLSLDPVISSEAQSNPVFSGLAAGTYSVTVVDGLNCISQPSANVVISEPSRVEPSLVLESRVTCKTSATLTLSAIGGTGSYEYSTDAAFTTVLGGFASSTTFAVGLGDHQYYVRDSKGCIGAISNNITVNPITPLSLDLDLSDAKIYCKGSATASIDAIAVGGLGDYIYTLLDNSGGVVRPAQPEGYFDLLPKGTYVVRVDSGDCQYDSAPIVVNEPNEVLSVVPTVTDATCFASNDGKISIAATGGTGVIKYAISPNLGMFDDKFAFDRLAPGFYDIVVQDENSCFEVLKLEIKEPALLGAKVVGPILQEICDGDKDGAFSIEIFGGKPPYSVSLDNENGVYSPVTGTNYDFTGLKGGEHSVYIKDATCISKVDVVMDKAVVLDPTVDINYDCVNNAQTNMVTVTVDKSNTDLTQIDYSLDGTGTYQPGNIFTNVAPGRHFIVARHTNGCKVPTASFDIKAYDPLTLAVSGGKPEMNIISVTAGGGAPAYEYSFNGEPFTSSNRYKIYKSGDYVVVVRDRNGCTATITVPAIYVDVCLDNYFTPAGVTNTTWGPGCTNIYNNLEFSIFDRYGRVIVKYHYGQKWDGRYNGAELPSGDYWYVLKLNDPKDDREFVGHFTLYR